MGYLIRKTLRHGLNPVVTSRNRFLDYIELDLLFLKPGERFAPDKGRGKKAKKKEEVMVVLSGKGNIALDGKTPVAIGEREDVFSGKAWGVYIPFGHKYLLEAIEAMEIALCRAPSDLDVGPVIIPPEKVKERRVGKANFERMVYDIVDVDIKARHLVVGETVNPPGNWSSYPPHKHDIDNLPEEADLEEVYLFRVKPPHGFGLIRLYNEDISLDMPYALRENDVVVIPEGYHPVAAAPGYSLYYLWILAGEKRVLKPKDDPMHSWVNRENYV